MKQLFLTLLLVILCASVSNSSDSIIDIYGPVTSVDITPINNSSEAFGDGGQSTGYRRSITVRDKRYPLSSKLVIMRAVHPPAMYPKVPARLSDVTPGINVNLRLSGHSVIEIVIER